MTAVDTFDSLLSGLSSVAEHAFAITPHDTNELAYVTRGLYVGGAGDVTIITNNDETVTLSGARAGAIIPIRAKQVKATGTTATLLVGLY
jgi:hypothetical protein